MTVKQLQKLLDKMPKDAEVGYYDGDNGLIYIEEVSHQDKIIINPWQIKPQTKPANIVILGA